MTAMSKKTLKLCKQLQAAASNLRADAVELVVFADAIMQAAAAALEQEELKPEEAEPGGEMT